MQDQTAECTLNSMSEAEIRVFSDRIGVLLVRSTEQQSSERVLLLL